MGSRIAGRAASRLGLILSLGAAVALVVVVVVLEVRSSEVDWDGAEYDLVAYAPEPNLRLELPGMSLETPGPAPVTGDYGTGAVQRTGLVEWRVQWQRGKMPPLDVARKVVDKMLGVLSQQQYSSPRVVTEREIAVAGVPAYQFELTNTFGTVILFTLFSCDGRVVQVFVSGKQIQSMTGAMLTSFRCTPEPASEPDRASVAEEASVVVDVRPGWKRTSGDKLMLVNDRELVVQPRLLPHIEAGTLEAAFPSLADAAGFRLAETPPTKLGDRTLWRGTLMVGGGKPTAVLGWVCPHDGRVALVYVTSMAVAPLDDGIALARTGRCLAPGDRPPPYPVQSR